MHEYVSHHHQDNHCLPGCNVLCYNAMNRILNIDMVRDAPILPAIFLENYVGKSKEQNAGKIGGKLEKWAPRNGNLAHFV